MIKNFLSKHKKIFIVLGFLTLIVLFFYLTLEEENQTQTSSNFYLVSKQPQEEVINSPWSVEPITLTYNKPIKEGSVQYTVSPSIETKINFKPSKPDQFAIVPLEGWVNNQKYNISILSVESVGEEKAAPHSFSFTKTFNADEQPEIPDEHSNEEGPF